MSKQAIRARQKVRAMGMTSPEGVNDPETKRILEQVQAAIEAVNQRIPQLETQGTNAVVRFSMLTRGEVAGNRLRLIGCQLGFVNGKLESISAEKLIKELLITQNFSAKDITNIFNIAETAGTTTAMNDRSYYMGGWVTP